MERPFNDATRRNIAARCAHFARIVQDAMGQNGVQMIAVCDVDRPNADFAAAEVNRRNGNNNCQIFTDYRELLRNNDIQAVTIGTPDHWQIIHPTTKWQSMQSSFSKDDFQVATDLYYVDVNKQ